MSCPCARRSSDRRGEPPEPAMLDRLQSWKSTQVTDYRECQRSTIMMLTDVPKRQGLPSCAALSDLRPRCPAARNKVMGKAPGQALANPLKAARRRPFAMPKRVANSRQHAGGVAGKTPAAQWASRVTGSCDFQAGRTGRNTKERVASFRPSRHALKGLLSRCTNRCRMCVVIPFSSERLNVLDLVPGNACRLRQPGSITQIIAAPRRRYRRNAYAFSAPILLDQRVHVPPPRQCRPRSATTVGSHHGEMRISGNAAGNSRPRLSPCLAAIGADGCPVPRYSASRQWVGVSRVVVLVRPRRASGEP